MPDMENRKRRVMIACVTFETVKISEPAEFYGANVVYLIHHVAEPAPGNVYQEFYDRTVELIRAGCPGVEVHGLDRRVSDFAEMLRTINAIVTAEKKASPETEMRINLSAGSPEFIAAGTTASMMEPNLRAFFTRAGSYQVSSENLRSVYYENGVPVGLTSSVKDVEDMPEFKVEVPDEILVRALRVYLQVSRGSSVYSANVVGELRRSGLWLRPVDTVHFDTVVSDLPDINDKVFFQRRYVDAWKARGWVVKRNGGYVPTETGSVVVNVMYPDDEDLSA